jgi:hypothetical protein
VDIYFIIDIFVNFRTAFYDARGILEIDLVTIAREYAKTWLVIDVVTCLPISYVMILINGTDSAGDGKEVRAAKILRLLKLGKLLRVARLIRILERYQEQLRGLWNAIGGWVRPRTISYRL